MMGPGKDLADYTGVFVRRAENAAEDVEKAISREGNPDVYAVKQNVHVFVYNCLPERIDERYENLLQAFEGEELYN